MWCYEVVYNQVLYKKYNLFGLNPCSLFNHVALSCFVSGIISPAVAVSSALPNLRVLLTNACTVNECSFEDLANDAYVARSSLFAWMGASAVPSAAAWMLLCESLDVDPVVFWYQAGGEKQSVIWEERMRRGWSQATLAAKAGVAFRTVAQAEAGGNVRPDALARINAHLAANPVKNPLPVQLPAWACGSQDVDVLNFV